MNGIKRIAATFNRVCNSKSSDSNLSVVLAGSNRCRDAFASCSALATSHAKSDIPVSNVLLSKIIGRLCTRLCDKSEIILAMSGFLANKDAGIHHSHYFDKFSKFN